MTENKKAIEDIDFSIDEKDLKIEIFGTGISGNYRGYRMTHIPSNIVVEGVNKRECIERLIHSNSIREYRKRMGNKENKE